MNINEYVKELVVQYEELFGRKLTPAEYLEFRQQAMKEIDNGFCSSTITESVSTVPKQIIAVETAPIEKSAPVITSVAEKQVQIDDKPIMVAKETVPVEKATVEKEPAVIVPITTKTDDDWDDDDSDDNEEDSSSSFFAMIDAMDM